MAYQIPQQLEYNEKIMFGLTFRQLMYAFLFGGVSLVLFKRINNEILMIVCVGIVSTLGFGFIFFDLESMIKNYLIYLRKRELDNFKLKKFLGIKKIEKKFILNSKKKKIAVLKVSTINFSMKPTKEKEAVIKSFQKFLNSLDFPTQILMSTESIRLGDYLDSLKSRVKKKGFIKLFEEYKTHLQKVIKTNKIMNRVFYLVITESSDIDIQVRVCLERLGGLNLKAKQLGSKELRKLVKGFLIRGDKNILSNNKNYLKINNQYCRVIYASGYPRYVESGFLDRIISSLGDFDLSIHIKPYPIEGMLVGLNRELQKQRADLYSMQMKGIVNPSLDIQYRDTRGTLEDLQKGKDRLFNVSLYVSCKAGSLDELDLLTKKVESELNGLMILPKIPNFRMLHGFKSVSPLGVDALNYYRNVTTSALSAFFPFTSQFLDVDDEGVWLGLNRNNIPVIKDIFKLSNPNGLVLSQSGGGKSYFCKLLITRYLLNGTRVMIIDPQGEYKNIVGHFKGERIDLSKDSNNIINPLDLMGHDYLEKRLSLIDLMKIMLGDLSDIQRAFIDKALTKVYESRGISENPDTWDNEPPILGDLLKVLKKMGKRATRLEKTTINSLINRMEMYVSGVFSFFNKKTNINFDNDLVCFDIGHMPSQVKPVAMFLVLDYIYMKMKANLDRKILLIDESWSLLSRAEDASYIFEIVKTCRKFNLGLLLINQEVEGLLDSKAGKSVLANSAYTMLMKQKPAVIDNICRTFHLSGSERNHLLTADVGEGLLIMEDEHSEIKVVSSPEEHGLITTNADELKELDGEGLKKKKLRGKKDLKKVGKKKRDVVINVDEYQRFFRRKDLNRDEVKFLLSKGYKIARYKSLVSNKIEAFLLQPRHNESLTHLFVIFDICDYLERKGIKVQKFVTKKPDIVFAVNGKRFAIEVETGSVLEKAPNQLREKVRLLNKNYDEWFFVVTNKNKIYKYREFGKVIDMRYLRRQINKILRLKKSHPI